MASNTKVISSTTLSHHYRLIHVWNLSLNDRFIKYYWNEHFTLCLICNSSACSSVHTKYHISFHATWASCLWTCLNKLYRGERSYKLLFFGAANTHFSPASSCFLIFFIISLCLALPCFIAPRSIPRFCLELLLMRAAAASLKCILCMHIYEILVFVLSPHAFISQWRESSTSLGSVCGLYGYFVTHTIKTHFALIWYLTSLPPSNVHFFFYSLLSSQSVLTIADWLICTWCFLCSSKQLFICSFEKLFSSPLLSAAAFNFCFFDL